MESSDHRARISVGLEVLEGVENKDPTDTSVNPSREDMVKAARLAARWDKRCKDGYDDYGAEMGKEARIWKHYVEETDRVDREMVQGWNKSLDVLLIFAALFSAISTAFVAISSQALQEDSASTSAQTLLVISQTLLSISNSQTANSSVSATQGPPVFTPSRTAVLVNALWFLSLSLSVAVSLVAMLAKEWCHAFVSERSGGAYNKGRLRQKRWNEIERLKMIDVMTFLPILMHLALLLFAIGLCVFLWNISVPVALPVMVITFICLGVYASTIAHSLAFDHCPYTTASSKLVKSYLKAWFKSFKPLFSSLINPTAFYVDSWLTGAASYLKPWFMRIIPWFQRMEESVASAKNYSKTIFAAIQRVVHKTEHTTAQGEAIVIDDTMDVTTSQMLAWMLKNSEDLKLSSVVIEALAGAKPWLPRLPLLESGALKVAFQHLDATFGYDVFQDTYSLKYTTKPEVASLYLRALHFLLGKHNGHWFFLENQGEEVKDSWGRNFYPIDYRGMAGGLRYYWPKYKLEPFSDDPNISAFWSSFTLAVTSANHVFTRCSTLDQDGDILAIEEHMAGRVLLHHATLIALVRSITDRLCLPERYWEDSTEIHLGLCVLLLKLYDHLDRFEKEAELGLSIALGIAASAFTFGSYPGGTSPYSAHATASRGDEFVVHHQQPTDVFKDGELSAGLTIWERIVGLLGFGLLGLFEHPLAHRLTSQDLETWHKTYKRFQDGRHYQEFNLYSIPRAFTFGAHAARVMSQYLQKRLLNDEFNQHSAKWLLCHSTLFSQSLSGVNERMDVNQSLHSLLLSCLCTVKSPEQQRICALLLDLSPSCDGSCLEGSPRNTLKMLLDTSLSGNTRIAPTAMNHLWMLTQEILKLEDRSPAISLLLSSLCPTDSPAPKDETETWLIQQLYPHILVMCRDAPRELNDSGVLEKIYLDLDYGQEIILYDNHGGTGTGDRTLRIRDSIFRELRDRCLSAVEAENQRWQELPYFLSNEQPENRGN